MASKKQPPYPVKKWVVPEELANGQHNGQLPENMLRTIRGGGKLFRRAASDWNRMWRTAKREGIEIRNVSRGYRSLATQVAMFRKRYSRKPTGRKPEVKRVWNGTTYYLRRGQSPSAVPGTSPHGWGCAQDIDHRDKKAFRWMCENAPKFHFYLQAERGSPFQEDWHWHWIEPTKDDSV
jgi:LAS superfamily LD-carboxypeptidase LdcB